MITDRNLKPGTILHATYRGDDYHLTVVGDGRYILDFDAKGERRDPFKSPSAAAMAITGNSVNGWRFWTVQDYTDGADIPGPEAFLDPVYGQDVERAHRLLAAQEPPAAPKRRGRKPIHVLSFLKGDHTRYWCAACQTSYPIEVGALLPAVCPAGHRDDDPELTSPAPTREWSAEEKMSALATAEGEFNIDNMTPHSESSRYYDDPATDR